MAHLPTSVALTYSASGWMRPARRLTIEAGNLAGSSLNMMSAVTYAQRNLGVSLPEAIFMASLGPAKAIGLGHELGEIAVG